MSLQPNYVSTLPRKTENDSETAGHFMLYAASSVKPVVPNRNWKTFKVQTVKEKDKVLPKSLPSAEPGADPGVQAVIPGGRLPLIAFRQAFSHIPS